MPQSVSMGFYATMRIMASPVLGVRPAHQPAPVLFSKKSDLDCVTVPTAIILAMLVLPVLTIFQGHDYTPLVTAGVLSLETEAMYSSPFGLTQPQEIAEALAARLPDAQRTLFLANVMPKLPNVNDRKRDYTRMERILEELFPSGLSIHRQPVVQHL